MEIRVELLLHIEWSNGACLEAHVQMGDPRVELEITGGNVYHIMDGWMDGYEKQRYEGSKSV